MSASHHCARCNAECPHVGPYEVEAWSAKHKERCFVVGDWVRGEWNNGIHVVIEGEVTSRSYMIDGHMNVGIRIAESNTFVVGARCDFRLKPGDLRHIQRPGQAVQETAAIERDRFAMAERKGAGFHATDCSYYESVDANCTCDEQTAQRPPAPTLYDELTSEQCLERWCRNQRSDGHSEELTTTQLAAARTLWQQRLRVRIDAARERERVRVVVDLQDVEDLKW